MKIVEVCPYDMARPGGVQAHVRALADWFGRNGDEVRIVAPRRLNGDGVPGIDCIGRTRRITVHGTLTEICHVPRGELRALADDLRAWGADILHLHTPWTPLLPWQVWRSTRLPAVATFHATLPGSATGGLLGRGMRAVATYFLKRLDATVVPSVSPLAHLKAMPGIPAPVVLPPTVDLSAWFAAGNEREQTAGGPNVVFLGRFEHRKGLDVLIDAWRRVSPRVPEATLTIAGGGALVTLVHEAQAAPFGSSIRYVPEPSDADARQLVAASDVFVAPSRYGESFGIVLIEAMTAGAVPVAAANSGYVTVMTGPGQELLVQPGDAEQLAVRLESLLRDAALRARLRDWGKAHAASYDVAAVGPDFRKLFEDVLRRRGDG